MPRRAAARISVHTVDTHRAHVMRKLKLQTRAELVLYALANGLIGPT
jgi:two-component system, NarL family, response regulator NreC